MPVKNRFRTRPQSFDACETAIVPNNDETATFEAFYDLDLASAFLCPARIGGDLWGLVPLTRNRIGLFCADVCGHGPEVAPYATLVGRYFVQPEIRSLLPGELLTDLNLHLCDNLPAGKFVALFYGVIDRQNHTLEYSCSTFMPPLRRAGPNGRFEPLPGEGLPLGFIPEAEYDTLSRRFPPGSALVVYSDALVETPLPPEAIYTPHTLCDRLNDLPRRSFSSEMNDALMRGLDLGSNRLLDELTLVCLQRGW